MTALVVALAVAVALLAVLVAGLLRSHAEILRALHELGAGLDLDRAAGHGAPAGPEVAPGVAAPRRPTGVRVPEQLTGTVLGADGAQEGYGLSLRGAPVLLAFLSSGCTGCAPFWETFAGPVDEVPAGARLVVVTRDAEEEDLRVLRRRHPSVPLVLSSEAWDAFDVPGSPYFALVQDGRLAGEGSGASWPQVADLLGQAVSGRGTRSGTRRERRDDAALAAAGIRPGHPSLEPPPGDRS